MKDVFRKYVLRREVQERSSGQLELRVYAREVVVERGKNKMPVHKVKGGYRWGKTGKIYKSKEKARKQGIAILISQGKIKVKGGTNKKK